MRARNIKPGFYKNSDLSECSMAARLLAPGLWMLADREGRICDRPKQIKGEIFPYEEVDIEALLIELNGAKHIERYEIDGRQYIQILEFRKHQSPHHKEKQSVIPQKASVSPRGKPRKASVSPPLNPDIMNPDIMNTGLAGLCVEDIKDWLEEKHRDGVYLNHDPKFVLDKFKNYCMSKGKTYKNYIAAYRNAFDWDSCQPKNIKSPMKGDVV